MKKTAKKFDTTTEHYWVPAALFLLNINIVHVVFAYATIPLANWSGQLALISVATIALATALVVKNRFYLIGAMAFYLLVLITAF